MNDELYDGWSGGSQGGARGHWWLTVAVVAVRSGDVVYGVINVLFPLRPRSFALWCCPQSKAFDVSMVCLQVYALARACVRVCVCAVRTRIVRSIGFSTLFRRCGVYTVARTKKNRRKNSHLHVAAVSFPVHWKGRGLSRTAFVSSGKCIISQRFILSFPGMSFSSCLDKQTQKSPRSNTEDLFPTLFFLFCFCYLQQSVFHWSTRIFSCLHLLLLVLLLMVVVVVLCTGHCHHNLGPGSVWWMPLSRVEAWSTFTKEIFRVRYQQKTHHQTEPTSPGGRFSSLQSSHFFCADCRAEWWSAAMHMCMCACFYALPLFLPSIGTAFSYKQFKKQLLKEQLSDTPLGIGREVSCLSRHAWRMSTFPIWPQRVVYKPLWLWWGVID